MFYKKKTLPEEGDIVTCTVKKILHHSIFATLDEFENLEGLLNISELAPGRIRNIRDYVTPNKKIICKVIRVNSENRHIDLSLRRVPQGIKKQKEEFNKQEAKAEKILESTGTKLKLSLKDMYSNSGEKIIQTYGNLSICFNEVVAKGEKILTDLKIDPKISKPLSDLILEKILPKLITIENIFEIECTKSNGITIIKQILISVLDKNKQYQVTITYLGAPRYRVLITSNDYKSAEKILKSMTEDIENLSHKNEVKFICQKRS